VVLSGRLVRPPGAVVERSRLGVEPLPAAGAGATRVTAARSTVRSPTESCAVPLFIVTALTTPVFVAVPSVQEICRPTRDVAEARFCALTMAVCDVVSASSFSTIVNCAVCAMNWLESVGLLGSWYLSCATSRLRNASLPSSALPVVPVCVVDPV